MKRNRFIIFFTDEKSVSKNEFNETNRLIKSLSTKSLLVILNQNVKMRNTSFFFLIHISPPLSLSLIPHTAIGYLTEASASISLPGDCHCVHAMSLSVLIGLFFFYLVSFFIPFLYLKFLVSKLFN